MAAGGVGMKNIRLRPSERFAINLFGNVSALFRGEVTEWPKVYDWKSYVPHKGTAGSNPALSATFLRSKKVPCVAQGSCATLRSKLRYEARAAERRRAK